MGPKPSGSPPVEGKGRIWCFKAAFLEFRIQGFEGVGGEAKDVPVPGHVKGTRATLGPARAIPVFTFQAGEELQMHIFPAENIDSSVLPPRRGPGEK